MQQYVIVGRGKNAEFLECEALYYPVGGRPVPANLSHRSSLYGVPIAAGPRRRLTQPKPKSKRPVETSNNPPGSGVSAAAVSVIGGKSSGPGNPGASEPKNMAVLFGTGVPPLKVTSTNSPVVSVPARAQLLLVRKLSVLAQPIVCPASEEGTVNDTLTEEIDCPVRFTRARQAVSPLTLLGIPPKLQLCHGAETAVPVLRISVNTTPESEGGIGSRIMWMSGMPSAAATSEKETITVVSNSRRKDFIG